jgi:hypothetical protein
MSKFKSFAQQGSFRDYQIQAPDETGKIKEETARTIRGKQRAQTSLERRDNLYLQAQKLAQGVEENQREQNFKLETENRNAYLDALRRDNEIETRNDKIAAAQSAETFKQLSAFSKSAFELYGQYQEVDLKRNQQDNAKLAYVAGADYKTVIAIQALGDNLTRSEFAQTEFMRQKLEEGGNVDALFALYERRASKAFINNIAVAQNTAYGYGIAAQQEQLDFKKRFEEENGRIPTIQEQKINSKAFETEYFVNITGADGRGLNSNLMSTYVAPIMHRIQTGFESDFNRQQNKEQQSIVKQNFAVSMTTALKNGGIAAVIAEVTANPTAEKFAMTADYFVNKSLDFGPTGISSEDLENILTYEYEGVNFKQTGKKTTLRLSRGGLDDVAKMEQSLNIRRRAEKQLDRASAENLTREAQSRGIELYNEVAADGNISQAEYERSQEQDRESGIAGFESEGTKQMAKELDSVRFEGAYTKVFDNQLDKGTLTLQDLDQKGVSFKLKQKYAPLVEKQNLLMDNQTYKDGVTAIGSAITEHPMVAKGRIGNKDHYSTILFKAEQIQQFKKDVLNGVPISEAVSGRLGIISGLQATDGAITPTGHYTKTVQSQAEGAVNYKEALQEDKAFIESSMTPNFRKDPYTAVNAYGQNNFYEDYYPMQRGEVTSQLKRRAAVMGVSPLVAINFLASGLSQPAIAMDAQVQAIANKITPIAGKLINTYRNSGSHLSRMSRADNIMDNTIAVARVRGEAPNPTPRQAYDYMRALGVSDIHAKGILANIEGEAKKTADGRFVTATIGDNGMSGGLFQMYNDRYRKMERSVPDWKTNWRGQIQHALQDDRAPEYLQMEFNSPEEAADWFLENYERPAMEHRPGRRELNRTFIPNLGF